MSRPESHDVRLLGGPDAPAQARRALVGWLRGHVDRDRLHDAKLLVSELVTNGVRHAPSGAIDLHVLVGDPLRVEVSDAGGRFQPATPVEPPFDAVGGRGLVIVDRIAATWGTAFDGGRNTVWFEL